MSDIDVYMNKTILEIICEGIKECKSLQLKQKTKTMKKFYEGSIRGFEECKEFKIPEDYKTRLDELSVLNKGFGTKIDIEKVWYLKGVRQQIDFVYQRLKFFN